MELVTKQGYKQTEVGLIPEDWEVINLKSISSLITKGTTPSKFSKEGIPFVKIESLVGDMIDKEKCLLISPHIHKNELKRSILEEHDLLFAIAGATIGKCTSVPKELIPSNTNQALAIIRLSNKNMKSLIFYSLKSAVMQNYILDNISTGAQPNLNLEQIGKFTFPIPPTLTEQKAIANALSDIDDLITSLDKLMAKKKDIKKGAMQQLLTPPQKGGKRLPGFSGDWEEKLLEECLDYEQPTNYLVASSKYEGQTQTPVLTAGKSFILGYTDEENGIFNNLPVIIFDDFTTACKYVDFPFKAKSSAMKMLIPKTGEFNLKVLYEIMLNQNFQVGDHKRHWISEYSQLAVHIPNKNEQDAIGKVFDDMDAEIKTLELKRSKYTQIKQGMMQQLLTGKTRLI